MNVNTLLNKMFPGEPCSGLPSFSELGLNSEQEFSLSSVNVPLPALGRRSEDEADVNDILKELKSVDFEQVQHFISQALDFYFTHPKVLAILQKGHTPLYPHVRNLGDIDYDLLAPVLEKNLGGFDG